MRIAVTGGSGFIAGHAVDQLIDAGHDVLALDIAAEPADPRADHRQVDILDLPALQHALAGVDVVFHIAGMSNVDFAAADPVHTVRLNVDGTGNVLEAARLNGVRRVIFASTVWVYDAVDGAGDQRRPLTEDAPFVLSKGGHIYTSTKIAAETLIHSYHQTYGVPFTILRYGIPYGPGMREELVLARFVKKALAGEALTVAGDGLQFRNYVYIDDLVKAHVLALDDAAENQVIALEGAEQITVLTMAQTVQQLFPGVTIEHIPARSGDFRGRQISNAKAAQLLGWRPTTPFADGVRQYVQWYLGDRSGSVPADGSSLT